MFFTKNVIVTKMYKNNFYKNIDNKKISHQLGKYYKTTDTHIELSICYNM